MYNPYLRYTEQSVMTMTSGEMLVRLYDEAARQMKQGMAYIDANDVLAADTSLKKARAILNYLSVTLDHKYEISENLSSLYEFFINQIIEGSTRMQKEPIQEVLPMVEELRDTFSASEKIVRMQQGRPLASSGAGIAAIG